MRVHIATDHAGYELKEHLVTVLANEGYEVVDHGAHVYDALDDYPPMCIEAGEAVVADAEKFVLTFLATPFSEDARHQRRIDLMADYEASR